MARNVASKSPTKKSGALAKTPSKDAEVLDRARPLVGQKSVEIQPFRTIVKLPIALSETACRQSVENLNQVLADTITLRDLYKKASLAGRGSHFLSAPSPLQQTL